MKPEILQAVANAVSQERSLELVLKRIVEGLVRSGGVALIAQIGCDAKTHPD